MNLRSMERRGESGRNGKVLSTESEQSKVLIEENITWISIAMKVTLNSQKAPNKWGLCKTHASVLSSAIKFQPVAKLSSRMSHKCPRTITVATNVDELDFFLIVFTSLGCMLKATNSC